MRQRMVNEKAVDKTLRFLIELKLYCQGVDTFKIISDIHLQFNVNRSTGAACKALNIIKKEGNGYVWLANEPSRQMALTVLNYHLERAPNTMKATQIYGMAEFTGSVKSLHEVMNTIISQNERSTRGLKIASNQSSENLFTRDQQYFELVKAIATGLYASNEMGTYQELNDLSVKAARNLMDKAFTNGNG